MMSTKPRVLGVVALDGIRASVAASVVDWALARYAFEFSWNACLCATDRRFSARFWR